MKIQLCARIINNNIKSRDPDMDIPSNLSDEILRLRFNFTTDIVDKQYRSYVWNDGKVQALVTIDTALIAGILLIFQTFNDKISVFAFTLLSLSFVFLLISFIVCLVHAIPKIHSGIGNNNNLRTMVGIIEYSKEEYHSKINNLDLSNMIRMNCWQIAGMCKNNFRSHTLIRRGVILTITGVLTIAIALPIIVFSNWSNRSKVTTPIPITSGITSIPASSADSAVNIDSSSSKKIKRKNKKSMRP